MLLSLEINTFIFHKSTCSKYSIRQQKILKYMHSFARAAITKYHELSGLNSKNILSLVSGGFKSKIAVDLVSGEGSVSD